MIFASYNKNFYCSILVIFSPPLLLNFCLQIEFIVITFFFCIFSMVFLGMAGQFGPYDINAYVTIQSEFLGYINETVVVHIAEEIRDNAHHVIDKTIEMSWNGERKLKINQILIAVLVMLSSINLLK